MSEEEFYERLMWGGCRGRQLSNPFLSSEQRSRLLEKGSSQLLEDSFHLRIAGKRSDDSILRRNRGVVEDGPPVREVFVSTRQQHQMFHDSIIQEILWTPDEQACIARRSEGTRMLPDVCIFDDSHGFWRHNHYPLAEEEEVPLFLPTLDKSGHTAMKRKTSGGLPSSLEHGGKGLPSNYRGMSRFFFSRGLKRLSIENQNAEPCDLSLWVNSALGSHLTHLSLRGGSLELVQASVAQSLPALKSLDLSQCNLCDVSLPATWNLPKLTRLDLSHNFLTVFPDKVRYSS